MQSQAVPMVHPDWFDRLPFAGRATMLAFCIAAGILIGWAWASADLTGKIMGAAHWQLTHDVKDQAPSREPKPKGG